MKKVVRFLTTAAVSFGIYLLLTMSVKPYELILGAGIALLTALIVVKFLPFGLQTFNPIRILRTIVYVPVFVWKMIVANLQIAWIVIQPKLKINPSIVMAKTDLATPEGKLVLTSSITLTPGTLSVDVQDDKVFVHWVKTKGTEEKEAKEQILAPFEKFIRGITK